MALVQNPVATLVPPRICLTRVQKTYLISAKRQMKLYVQRHRPNGRPDFVTIIFVAPYAVRVIFVDD
ncbi:hypothetical protein D3C75_512190 [compost metagenome]